jgi:hypothetical protein
MQKHTTHLVPCMEIENNVHNMHLLRHAFGTFHGTVTQAKRI